MSHKKSKSGSNKKKATSHPKPKRTNSKPSKDDSAKAPSTQPLQNPQDRVAFVKPFWESLGAEERIQLLTVDVEEVFQRISKLDAIESDASLKEVYERGRRRLDSDGTWKVWQWDDTSPVFTCAETFRKEALESRVPAELLPLLPREDGKPMEKPAEAALRERMTTLINNIHTQLQTVQEAWKRGQRVAAESNEPTRDANIDLVISILDTLQHEHHCLYQMILIPVAEFICNLVPQKNRKTTKTELFFEDFDKLVPEDVAKLYEWLTEKVDALCSKLKPDPKDEDIDEDEEAVGDIDLFSLTENKRSFTVNPKWMEHLQERKLSEDGQPRKVKQGEDEHKIGLVLEWVYGSIVSTAEKARDGAKRGLGHWKPSVKQAKANLIEALNDQLEWDQRSKTARALLKDLLSIRKRMITLSKDYEVCIPGTAAYEESGEDCTQLPDPVIEGILQRESLLTDAKLHILKYDRMMANKQLKNLKNELIQGEPEFERLKRELENSKVVTRTEKDRNRSKLNDALLEDQLEVQSAFREQGARLQGLYDKRQRTEAEMTRREKEISQLENWKKNVNQLSKKFQTAISSAEQDLNEAALISARTSFHKDFKKQLYSDSDDQTFFSRIKSELKQVDKRVEDGLVVLQHLEMFLINIACDDPGALIGTSIILPLLQERLDAKAMEFSTKRASEAMNDLLQMEEERKLLLAKKETKRKSKGPLIVEEALDEFPPGPSSTEDLSSEAPEKPTEDLDLDPPCPPQETPNLDDLPFDDPVLIEKSRQYEAELLTESIEEEFQSVQRRQDRRRFQGKKPMINTASQKLPRSHSAKTVNQKKTSFDSGAKKLRSGVVLGSRSKSAKLTGDRGGSFRKPGFNRTRQQSLKKTQSLPNPQSKDSMDSRPIEHRTQKQSPVQGAPVVWTRGALPPSVTRKRSGQGSEDHHHHPIEGSQSIGSTQGSVSGSSVHVPSTPEVLDTERGLICDKSDPTSKTQMTLHDMKTALPQQSDIQELHDNESAPSSQLNSKDPEQGFSQEGVEIEGQEACSEFEGFEEEGSRIHSSDSETPEPEHMIMGPPLMPPPMGLPPPIGHPMPPTFHPNYYPQMRPMMNGMSLPVPPPMPHVFHPAMTGPMSTTEEDKGEDSSPPESSSPHSSLPLYPYYPPPPPHLMPPHGGHHLPMPPYPMVMPYGQWYPPGMHLMDPSALQEHDSQVKNFALRPTAEEFVPPSLRQEEDEDPVEDQESEDRVSEAKEEVGSEQDLSGVVLPEVKDSAVNVVTPIIRQTC